MGLVNSEFEDGDKAILTLGGHEIHGTVVSSYLEKDGLAVFKSEIFGENIIWVMPNSLKRPEPTNQELWDAIPLGGQFRFTDGEGHPNRVKISTQDYAILGKRQMYLYNPFYKPIVLDA